METAKKYMRRGIPYLAVIFMVLWQWPVWQHTAWAAGGGHGFSVESIQQAGVRDTAFAEAIYDSISAHIADGSYSVSPGDSTEKILLEYGAYTAQAEIDAQGRGIRDISGIWLLRHATRINLSDNRIQDLSPLKRDMSIEEQANYFAATEIVLTGNPIRRVPEQMIGFTAGNYRVDEIITVPVSLSYRNEAAERRLLLHYFEEPGGRPTEKAVVFRNREEAEILHSIERAYPLSFSVTARYLQQEGAEARLQLQWSMPLDVRFMREFEDAVYEKTLGSIELTATTEEGEPLPGICYRIWQADSGREILNTDGGADYITDEKGRIYIANLEAGTYRIEQQSRESGYEARRRSFQVVIRDARQGAGIPEKEKLCSGLPKSYALTGDVKNIRFLNRGEIQGIETETDTAVLQQAEVLNCDGFLSDLGYVELLKGELPYKEGYELLPGSRVSIYEDGTLLGSYAHPTEAKQVLNRRIREQDLQRDSRRIRVVEALFYDGGCQRVNAIFSRPGNSEIHRIVVKKSWRGAATPSEAYFRPVLRRNGEVVAVLGAVKTVNAANGWEVSWNLQATSSDARRGSMQRASMADAEREEEFREDAELLHDSGDTDGQIGVEEVDIPAGWKPEYRAFRRIGDSAYFDVTNRKETLAGIDRFFSRGENTANAKRPERQPELLRRTEDATEKKQAEPTKQPEVKHEEVKPQEARQEVQKADARSGREDEPHRQKQAEKRETATIAYLPWAEIGSCKVKKTQGQVPGRQLVLAGMGERTQRTVLRRLPHTGETVAKQVVWFHLAILWSLAMLLRALHMVARQH
jgi:hypothetical protein